MLWRDIRNAKERLMRILVVYNNPKSDQPDDMDTVVQALEIAETLKKLGHSTALQPIDADLNIIKEAVDRFKPDKIFNCVEEFKGSSCYNDELAQYLENLKIRFTGSNAKAHFLAASKLRSKVLLNEAKLPTPHFLAHNQKACETMQYIIKSSSEHASLGLDAHSIVTGSDKVSAKILEKKSAYAGEWFAEQYIEGREFNVAVIGASAAPVVLPINEIVFANFPANMPRIVDYNAKWNTASFSFHNTVRTPLQSEGESVLTGALSDFALRCWNLFELNGYARIDFRVDRNGAPWILEVNTNPCLSNDAGFMASAALAGFSAEATIEKILAHCVGES